jgi:hypothetical protein
MSIYQSDFAQAAFDRLARKHYRVFKSGRLYIKCCSDMSGGLVPLGKGQPTQIRAYATRPSVDLEGEVVLPDGMNPEYFKMNRTLFVDHEYHAMSAVGKLRNIIQNPTGVIIESVLIDNPDNPLRNQIEALAKAGNIGLSVGFEAMDYGAPDKIEKKNWPDAKTIHRKWRLLEVSYTAMPMNGVCQSDMENHKIAEQKTVVIL